MYWTLLDLTDSVSSGIDQQMAFSRYRGIMVKMPAWQGCSSYINYPCVLGGFLYKSERRGDQAPGLLSGLCVIALILFWAK